MKITRPNMADLFRTFTPSGESESRAVPETSVDMPALIQPVMEFCRPLERAEVSARTSPRDESVSRGFNVTVAAGGPAYATPELTMRRGVWRITTNLVAVPTGAAGLVPSATNVALLVLVGPDLALGAGIYLSIPTLGQVVTGQSDFLVHFPDDGWFLELEITDPVTAGVTNRVRGSTLACHLL